MNEVITNILERRSVRKYLPEQPKQEEIEQIVNAGLWAPSANNRQDWHVTVIKDENKIEKINSDYIEWMRPQIDNRRHAATMAEGYSVFHEAPLIMLVSYDATNTSWGQTNAALLVQNLCLAAESLGIGNCQIGLPMTMLRAPESADLLASLKLPEGYTPHLFISFGYPDTSVRTAKRPRAQGTVTYI